jgi:phosphatidylserine decarboxylase
MADEMGRACRCCIPITRWGAREIALLGIPLALLTAAAAYWYWPLAIVPASLLAFVLSFFRDPPRRVPQEPGLLVSPADGTVAEITPVEHDAFLGVPAVKVGIFLSIFNVHLNRSPATARVVDLRYSPGEFLNALRPASAERNESMWIGLEEQSPPNRRLVVRQIAGAIARRIVCRLRPGDTVARGGKFGMIKFGSRTELILPAAGAELTIKVGQRVKAGTTVVARYVS